MKGTQQQITWEGFRQGFNAGTRYLIFTWFWFGGFFLWLFGFVFYFCICVGEENVCSVTRGHAWPQRWGSRASVTSNPARLTFPFPTFPPELLGVQNESSEAQCDLLSCLYPSLTHQGKTSSQMARESSEPARTPTVPPKLPESLLLVSEGIQTLVPEQPCPTPQGEGKPRS